MFDVFIFVFPHIFCQDMVSTFVPLVPRYVIALTANITNGDLQIHGAATLKCRSEADMMVMMSQILRGTFFHGKFFWTMKTRISLP